MEFRTRHTTWNTWHTWKTWKTQQTRKSWSKYNISHVNTCSMCVLIRINHSTIHNFQLFVWLLPPIWKFLLIPHHSEIQYATPNNMLDNIVQFPFVLAYSNNSHPLNKLILITYPKPRNANDIHAATNNMKHMKIIANAQNRKHLKTTNVNAHPFFFFGCIRFNRISMMNMVDDCWTSISLPIWKYMSNLNVIQQFVCHIRTRWIICF